MWRVRITLNTGVSFVFEYDDPKDYRAWQRFWAGRGRSFQIEFLGKS